MPTTIKAGELTVRECRIVLLSLMKLRLEYEKAIGGRGVLIEIQEELMQRGEEIEDAIEKLSVLIGSSGLEETKKFIADQKRIKEIFINNERDQENG